MVVSAAPIAADQIDAFVVAVTEALRYDPAEVWSCPCGASLAWPFSPSAETRKLMWRRWTRDHAGPGCEPKAVTC